MMRLKTLLIPSTLVLLISAGSSSSPTQIAQNNNRFALDFYTQVAGKTKGNIFFSPNSISTAFAMCYGGANGSNAEEMAEVMHFAPNTEQFHTDFGAYNRLIEANAKGNIKLSIANRLWGEKTYSFQDDYIALLDKAYTAPLDRVNFYGNPEAQRARINTWVEDQTNDKIKNLLPEGSIDSETRMVLANAIYFKGDWLNQFKKKNTKTKKFNLEDGDKVQADYMISQRGLLYNENAVFKQIALPYKGNKQSMVVVLPHENNSMAQAEESMRKEAFSNLRYTSIQDVKLELPKFKMTIPLSLNTPLKKMGMKQAFDEGADFSKMTPSNDLYISSAVHKAFIEIDEEGTEAAAATAIVMSIATSAAPAPKPLPKEFKANRPFLFYIIDNETQAILFMGRVMDPS